MKKLLILCAASLVLTLCGEGMNMIQNADFSRAFDDYERHTAAFRLIPDPTRVLMITGVPHLGRGVNSRQALQQKIFTNIGSLRGSELKLTFEVKTVRLTGRLGLFLTEFDNKQRICATHFYDFEPKETADFSAAWVPVECRFKITREVAALYFTILADGLDSKDKVEIRNLSLLRVGTNSLAMPDAMPIPERMQGTPLRK